MADGWDDKRQAQLIDAVLTVTSGLELPEVLQHVVQAAVTLVEARHGALGVLDEDRRGLAQFVHTGSPPRSSSASVTCPRVAASSDC